MLVMEQQMLTGQKWIQELCHIEAGALCNGFQLLLQNSPSDMPSS